MPMYTLQYAIEVWKDKKWRTCRKIHNTLVTKYFREYIKGHWSIVISLRNPQAVGLIFVFIIQKVRTKNKINRHFGFLLLLYQRTHLTLNTKL